jgi:hypothetical protein
VTLPIANAAEVDVGFRASRMPYVIRLERTSICAWRHSCSGQAEPASADCSRIRATQPIRYAHCSVTWTESGENSCTKVHNVVAGSTEKIRKKADPADPGNLWSTFSSTGKKIYAYFPNQATIAAPLAYTIAASGSLGGDQ